MIKNELKGINLTWLSKVDLSNLNSGEGGSNYVDIKKFKIDGEEYPYVSGQAMRFYLKSSIRRLTSAGCVPDDKGENCGDIENCILCDLFGYMKPKVDVGANTRISPVKVSPAIGLYPFMDNSTLDFLTRKKTTEGKASGDIVHVELGHNLYRCGLSVDLRRISAEEKVDTKENKIILEEFGGIEQAKKRVDILLESIQYITDASKQARLLTDFTPDIVVISFQKIFSNRIQKMFSINKYGNLSLERIEQMISDAKLREEELVVGLLVNSFENEEEIVNSFEKLGLEVLSPTEAINKSIEIFKQNNINR